MLILTWGTSDRHVCQPDTQVIIRPPRPSHASSSGGAAYQNVTLVHIHNIETA